MQSGLCAFISQGNKLRPSSTPHAELFSCKQGCGVKSRAAEKSEVGLSDSIVSAVRVRLHNPDCKPIQNLHTSKPHQPEWELLLSKQAGRLHRAGSGGNHVCLHRSLFFSLPSLFLPVVPMTGNLVPNPFPVGAAGPAGSWGVWGLASVSLPGSLLESDPWCI